MQKNGNFYSFLLTHTTQTKIYIRRVEISKKFAHTTAASLILSLGVASFGFVKFTSNSVIAKSISQSPAQTVMAAQPVATFRASAEKATAEVEKSIDYSRPATAASFGSSINSGGPATPFQLTLVGSEAEETAMENQLRLIQKTTNQAFVPSMWAHLGKINNEFGFRRNPFGGRTYEFHPGLDIDGEKGDNVIAPANGVVMKAGPQGGYGNMIEIDHGNGLTTRYGHLSRIEIQVGDTIQRGQLIGLIGSTGRSTGPHLHFEIRLNDKPINPRRFLPPEPAELTKTN